MKTNKIKASQHSSVIFPRKSLQRYR